MKRPTEQQIEIAALWLDGNEGDGEEKEACAAVAVWLRHEANEAMLRSEARKAGVTVARLRRAITESLK